MDTAQGPLDLLPRVNYQPILTQQHYFATKQMINQILSEDQDYVSWKIKDLRTGGTMNTFLPSDIVHYDQAQVKKLQKLESKRNNKIVKKPSVNKVPTNLTFVRDIYQERLNEDILKELHNQPVEELSYEDQFKLLVLNLDDEQNDRFEVFHRTALNKGQVKKLASMVCNQNIGENIRVLLQSMGKVFAGEIIELALEVRKKWFVSKMVIEFDKRKEIASQLKKYLKKLTILVERDVSKDSNNKDEMNDSIYEEESDSYFTDEPDLMKETQKGNLLLKSKENNNEIRVGLIDHYNKLVKKFNLIDVSMEKYNNSPILPEHVREAWRLYQLQSETFLPAQWRRQGEADGNMFR